VPNEREHDQAADRHLKAAAASWKAFPDWGAVMVFYAALHRLEGAIAVHGLHNRDHKERNRFIRSHCASAWPSYLLLQNESLKARYLQGGKFSLTADQVRLNLHDVHYQKVAAAALALRSEPPPPLTAGS
jgi:hypothetical protein